MKLVANWRNAWRWFSMHCLILAGAIPCAWDGLPDDIKQHIPPSWMGAISAAVAISGVVGRLVDQSKRVPDER